MSEITDENIAAEILQYDYLAKNTPQDTIYGERQAVAFRNTAAAYRELQSSRQRIAALEKDADTVKQHLQTMIVSAEAYTDAAGVVTAYKIKTGAIHTLIGLLSLWVPSTLPELPRCCQCGGLPRITMLGRTICANCGSDMTNLAALSGSATKER